MNFCYKTATIWQIVGYILLIVKIVIPIILIILGMIDFSKAVISSDDKVIKDSAFTLLKRVVAAIIIFFIPTIINVAFNYIAGFSNSIREDYLNCVNCLTSPGEKCDTSYEGIFPIDN